MVNIALRWFIIIQFTVVLNFILFSKICGNTEFHTFSKNYANCDKSANYQQFSFFQVSLQRGLFNNRVTSGLYLGLYKIN